MSMPLCVSIGRTKLVILTGDLTEQSTDAIVNAANSDLRGGGGVDGAIHRAGGPTILEECQKYVQKHGPLPPGRAMITSGGNLKVSFVIHTVGPIYKSDRESAPVLANAYREDYAETKKDGKDEELRVSLSLPAAVAPVQVAVLPLMKKLRETAQPLFRDLRRLFRCEYDEGGTIGKRYRRQDEIGTPFCVTVDFETLEDNAVTVRDRDSMAQDRVGLDQLQAFLTERILTGS